jgi:hypothetical protein
MLLRSELLDVFEHGLIFCLVFHIGSLSANGSEPRCYPKQGEPLPAHAPSLFPKTATMGVFSLEK